MTTTQPKGNQELSMQDRFHEYMRHPMAPYSILKGATISLLVFGLVMVTSASSIFAYQLYGNSYYLATRQIIFAIIGVSLMFGAARLPIIFYRRISAVFLGVSILLLVLVLFIGTAVYGQRNWLEFGPIRIQPSEFAKLGVAVWGAHIFASKYEYLYIRRELINPVMPVFGLVLGLILAEGDLGTAMVITPIMAALYFFVGAPRSWFAILLGGAVAGLALLAYEAPYRVERFFSWLHPNRDPQGVGFQFAHGKQALGSGGFGGVGLGASREKWGTLPEAHTDFIYAVIGEEWGIGGTLIVLLLFVAIVISGIRIARNSSDRFVQLASLAVVVWIATQTFVNIGAVLGIMPITGVPLPLVSYGGSSLLPTLMALGMLMSFAKHGAYDEGE